MSSLRDNVDECVEMLCDTDIKLDACPDKDADIKDQLSQARSVFLQKAADQSRHLAWILGVVFTEDKMRDVAWLWRVTLRTLQTASTGGGPTGPSLPSDRGSSSSSSQNNNNKLFAFVTDVYIDVCLHAFDALRYYFKPALAHLAPTSTAVDIPGGTSAPSSIAEDVAYLRWYSQFLSTHFNDPRIVAGDMKDGITQSLACMLCYPDSLHAMETMPEHVQEQLITELMRPYESRAWAQTNWILVRIWKGSGFGFRYTKRPHMAHLPEKCSQHTMGLAAIQKPLPSHKLQQVVCKVLESDHAAAAAFLNSVINQLNWAFSEFVGVLQELHRNSTRPGQNTLYIDPRQLKICATCFDLSVGLLRALELVTATAPHVFCCGGSSGTSVQQQQQAPPGAAAAAQTTAAANRSTTELLLSRLWQVVCHVLNRLCVKSSIFEYVLNLGLTNLETVDHYPILTAVAGIMIQLIVNASDDKSMEATRLLLRDGGFSLSTLEYLIDKSAATAAAVDTATPAAAAARRGTPPAASAAAAAVAASDAAGGGADGMPPQLPILPTSDRSKPFSFTNYPEHITADEISTLRQLISHLQSQEMHFSSEMLDDSKICAICYASEAAVQFVPCGHTSCRACITHHLMNRKDCFFCKLVIERVIEHQANTSV